MLATYGKIVVSWSCQEVRLMELRVLQYFLAVAREQSISAAAQSLHLTQPTLSRQLRELEEELGKQLMVRGNRKITLTEEGMLLRKRAEEILELVDRTEQEVTQPGDAVSGDLYIGTGETDGVRQIARAAKELQTRYAGIRFHIVSGDAVDVCERLDKGLLDFGVLLGDIDKLKYRYLELPARCPYVDLLHMAEDSLDKDDQWMQDVGVHMLYLLLIEPYCLIAQEKKRHDRKEVSHQ